MGYNNSECIKNNKKGVEVLTEYCAGVLDPVVALQIDTHVLRCADCRQLVEAQRTVWEMLDAWTPLEVSQNFDSRLYARIAEEQAVPAWRQWLSRVFRPAVPYNFWKPAAGLVSGLAAAGLIVAVVTGVRVPDPSLLANKDAVRQTTRYDDTRYDDTRYDGARSGVPGKDTAYKGAVTQSSHKAAGSAEIDLDQVQQALDDMDLLSPVGQSPSSPL